MNILIKNAQVLLTQPEFEVRQTDVYLRDNVIAAVGQPPAPDFVPDKTLDATGKLLMPGLINCHTHLYMTLMRNYADDLSFGDWLFGRIMPKEDLIQPEDAYWCNLLSCLEMIRSGTTCYLDMHMFRHQSIRASQEAGMRAVLSRGIVGESGSDAGALERLQDTLDELEAAAQHDGRVHCMLGPHAIYTCAEDLLCHLREVARDKGLRFHIHLAETQTEFDDCMAKNGCTPTEYLARIGLFDVPTVAAHGVYLTDHDIELLSQYGVSIATNPISNMKLGNGFAPVPKLLQAGVNVCLGTDSAASNNNLNMFKELSVLSLIHKGVQRDPQTVDARQVLRCATQNGAAALGLADQIGTIEPGKKADLILIDLNRPQLQPVNDIPASLVYSANGSEVDTVLIDGRIIMENGRVCTIDEERVYFEVQKIAKRIL